MKILANFTIDNIFFKDAYQYQYQKYMKKKPDNFQAWINLPGTQRTQKEHNAFWGDVGLVAKLLKLSPEWIYWHTRNSADFLRDLFEIDEYDIDGNFVGKRIRGLSEIDHEDMINYKVIERFRACWQDEIDQYFGYHVHIHWYSIER